MLRYLPKPFIPPLLGLAMLCLVAAELPATCRVPVWRETSILDLYPRDLAAADLNGDRRPDVIAASATSVYVALNTTTGFGPRVPPVTLSGTFAYGVAIADFDGDGDNDIVVADKLVPGLMTLRNNGDGSFAAPLVSQITLTPSRIINGDFDGDGRQDIILYAEATQTLAVFTGNGDGTFTQKATTPIAVQPVSLAAGDLDGDGHLDIVVGHFNSAVLEVFFGNATATFEAAVPVTSRMYPLLTAVADLRHDGYRDIVSASSSEFVLSVLRNITGRSFGYPLTWQGSSPLGMAVDDFTGDGLADAILITPYTIASYHGWGDATLSNWFTRYSADYPYATYYAGLASADFDGDGRIDLVEVMGESQYYVRVWIVTNLCGDSRVTASVPSPLITLGQTATVKVHVGPPTNERTYPTVTGTVTVREGSTEMGTQPVTSAGDAALSIPGLGLGEHAIVASYVGDDQYGAAESAPVIQKVTTDTSTLGVTVTPALGTYGIPPCFATTVTTTNGTAATGDINLSFDGGAPVRYTVGSWSPYCYDPILTVGDHTVVVQYLGDATHPKSDPVTLSYPITRSKFTASLSPEAAVAGIPATLQISLLLPGSFGYSATTPTGTVTVSDGTTTLASKLLTGSWTSYYGYSFMIGPFDFAAGAHQIHVTYPGDARFEPVDVYMRLAVMPAGTASLEARGTASSIKVTYSYPEGDSYTIIRSRPDGTINGYGWLDTIWGVWTDSYPAANTVYIYRGRRNSDNSAIGPADLGVRISFTDDPLQPGTVIKAVHLTEIVDAVNVVRQAAGLSDITVSGLSPGGIITAAHINALRDAITEARSRLGVSPAVFSEAVVAGQTVIRAAHIQELRESVR